MGLFLTLVRKVFIRPASALFAVCLVLSLPTFSQDTSTTRTQIKIPMESAGPAGLQAWLLTPPADHPLPLVIMTHDWMELSSQRHEVGPGLLLPEALWFVHRGWAVAIVMRRGYGDSGPLEEHPLFPCGQANLENYAMRDAEELRAAYNFFSTQTHLDKSRFIIVGEGGGASAALTFAYQNPGAVKAIVAFSIRWPMLLMNHAWVCKNKQPSTFGSLPQSGTTPMIWLYGRHDAALGTKDAAKVHEAFTTAGGKAELIILPASSTNSQFPFRSEVDHWTAPVEQFLAAQNLPSAELISQPHAKPLSLPPQFSSQAQEAFERFQTLGPFKAFAVSPSGVWSYCYARKSPQEAEKEALNSCRRSDCIIYARD